ncbi:MAG TPA: type II secretion system protein GspG, partial [Kofleriaceae bacterium]
DDDARHSEATMLVTKLVEEGFPAWRAHHAGCPRRLSQLLPGAHLDPWGHALHYTCDPRLASGGTFAVFSAGEDGVFGTADDIEAHR